MITTPQKMHTSQSPGGHSGAVSRTAAAAAPANQFDPWILWVTVRRCWPWAVPIGLLLAALAAVFVMRSFVPRYRASHLLEANQDFVAFKGVMPIHDDLAATERAIFLTPIVIDRVLADAKLQDAPSLSDPETAEQNLRKNLTLSSAGTTKRLIVAYEDTDREAAAKVCNAIVDSYLRQRDAFDNQRVANLEDWLDPEIRNWQDEVEDRRNKVRELQKTLLGYAPGQRLEAIEEENKMTLISDLRAQITELEVQLSIMDGHLKMAESEMENEEEPSENLAKFVPPVYTVERKKWTESQIDAIVAEDPKVVEAESLVNRYKKMLLEMEDADLIRLNRERYRELQQKRDAAMATIESVKAAARPDAEARFEQIVEEDFRLRTEAVEQQVSLAEAAFYAKQKQDVIDRQKEKEARLAAQKREREALVNQLSVLRTKFQDEYQRAEQYIGESAKLQFAQEEQAVATDVLQTLRSRVAAIRTERRQDGAVRSLAEATPPKTPVETVPMKKLLAASGAAFMIPFLLGLIWEFKVQRVTDSSSLEKNFGLARVVGEVAKLPAGTQSNRDRRVFEESIDSLRSNLLLSIDTRHARSIAVVSSMSGEGKSSVASQLAISIAKSSGETVLLIDTDVRCPDQHDIFGLEMGPGLCGVLAGEAKLEEAVDSSLGELIHVLPAGPLNQSPHRLINPAAINELLDQALQSYQYVVFDTAPVLAASESLVVAAAVDTTLLCIMRDVSRMDSVNRTTRRLEASGATIAGTVFSGVTPRKYAYRYGDYRYAVAGEAMDA